MSRLLGAQAILLLLVHLIGDFYGSFYYPLVPVLRERFNLTLTATGALAAIFAAATSYFQPVAGMLGERFGHRRMVVAGVLAATLGMSMMGLCWSFPSLCALLIIGGLGVALYHPIGATMAGRSGGTQHVKAIAVYVVGGHFGVMLAPLIVPMVVQKDLRRLVLLAAPGIIFAAILQRRLRVDIPKEAEREPISGIWRVFKRLWAIHLDVVLRFIPISAYTVLLPLYCTLAGMSTEAGGRSLAFFMLAGAAGILSSGWLAARIPNRPMAGVSELLGGIFLILAPMTHGILFFALIGLGSFVVWAVAPIQISAAQKMSPRSESTASGIVMGLAAGNAGLMLAPIGWLGDHWATATGSEFVSAQRMLQFSAIFLFIAAAATFLQKRTEEARIEP